MLTRTLAWGVLALVVASSPAIADGDFSLCTEDEINFSSCRIGKKIASFCASKKLGKDTGYFQYRFGSKDRIELLYPATKRFPTGLFFASREMLGNGNERYIAFYRGTYKYLYYERSIYGRPEAEGRVQNGVAIVKDGKTIQYLSCSAMSDGLSGPKSRPFILPDFFVDEAFTAF